MCPCALKGLLSHKKKTVSTGEDEDDEYKDSDDIVSRTQFPESWLWEDVTLPTCAEKHW